jgi:hypothetical protein
MPFTAVAKLPEHRERFAFKGMKRPDYSDLSGQVAEVGSVSWVSSIESTTMC